MWNRITSLWTLFPTGWTSLFLEIHCPFFFSFGGHKLDVLYLYVLQRFQKCQYAKTKLVKTEGRGWGLLADENIKVALIKLEQVCVVIFCVFVSFCILCYCKPHFIRSFWPSWFAIYCRQASLLLNIVVK